MATSLPSHRKLNLPRFDGDLRTRPGKHEPPETNHDPTHDDILPYSHPLSPHATCSEDDPSQSINETNLQSHAPKSLAGRTIASHPLSPHDTSLDDENQVLSTTTSSSTSTSTRNLYTPSTTTPTDSNFPATTSGPSNSHRSNTNININNNNNNSSTPTKTILVINGPNLNLLGHREPHIYGHTSLQDITDNLANIASSQGIQLHHFQSNHEGQILDRIHACLLNRPIHPLSSSEWLPVASPSATTTTATTSTTTTTASPATNKLKPDAIIINPGALTHTSIALRDALTGIATPFIEVHISNVHSRESFRHKSYLSDKATAVVAGLGVFGYEAALRYWISEWRKPTDVDDGNGGTDATDANANARGLAGVKPS